MKIMRMTEGISARALPTATTRLISVSMVTDHVVCNEDQREATLMWPWVGKVTRASFYEQLRADLQPSK